MTRFEVVAWGKQETSHEVYNTAVDFRAGLRTVADNRYSNWHIEIKEGPWERIFENYVQAFTDGDFAPTTGPHKRGWHYANRGDGSHWQKNKVGSIIVSDVIADYKFEPSWVKCPGAWSPRWFPPPSNQVA